MKHILAGLVIGILFVATSDTDIGAQWMDSSWKLAQAIGADLITDTESTDSASTPKSEIQPAPVAPEPVPTAPQPEPVISDTTA